MSKQRAMNDQRELNIRPARATDAEDWLRLRCALCPDGADDHPGEIAAFFAGRIEEPAAVFVAERDGVCTAVMELSIRVDLPVYAGARVAFVEGLYVVPEFRGGNVARRLLETARAWARQNHCNVAATDRAGRPIVDGKYRA